MTAVPAPRAAPVRTACPYCGVGCGIKARALAGGGCEVSGDESHPANRGSLCSKGAALGETVSLEDRLLYPEIGGARAKWDEALDLVAARFAETIEELGPESVAFYISGQFLTEDYYVANKLMKGFVGAANIDTNSRLCMASAVAGHRRAFGSDTVPGCYEDFELADLVVLVGSNLAWCHPVLYRRLSAAKERRPGMKVVVVDPRRTATCEIADMHLAIRPDADVPLFSGLLSWLAAANRFDPAYIARHTSGFENALAAAHRWMPGEVARATGLTRGEIEAFYTLFAETEKAVTAFSQGVNQSVSGTDKVNTIINCHLATGRIGTPGAGPFSITGQPNAMGGREVGGLANTLAAHMELENADHRALVKKFWNAPRIADRPGLKAVDLFDAVADGRIKAIWIMATNPAVSMPDADRVKAALAACPFVVVSDVVATDTLNLAHVKLPALAWGEKSGTVTNSERRISRQRAFLPAPGEAKADWWALAAVAARMGFADAFAYDGPADIFREHAALSAAENNGTRDFDIGALAGISNEDYDALAPVQWPVPAGDKTRRGPRRFFAAGGFFTGDGRARFVVPQRNASAAPAHPFVLNTGRIRDQWHTMTRTGRSPRLAAHIAEPFAELHPSDATKIGVEAAELVRVGNDRGSTIVRALVTDRQQEGSIFVPMHWTERLSSAGRANVPVAPAADPVSGQPGLKASRVSITRFPAAWYGFAVARARPANIPSDYWAVAAADGGVRMELAGLYAPHDWEAFARTLLGSGALVSLSDQARHIHRYAVLDENGVTGALFTSPEPVAVSRVWAASLLGGGKSAFAALAGRPPNGAADRGPVICSCFGVGANEIKDAIAAGVASVHEIGEEIRAGTNCGSCRSEIAQLVKTACGPFFGHA